MEKEVTTLLKELSFSHEKESGLVKAEEVIHHVSCDTTVRIKCSCGRETVLPACCCSSGERYVRAVSEPLIHCDREQNHENGDRSAIKADENGSAKKETRQDGDSKVIKSLGYQTKEVRFSFVEVREYEQIMGDHPCVSSGPALGIGWNYDETKTEVIPVDHYGFYYGSRANVLANDMTVSRAHREQIMRELGYTKAQIASNVRMLTKIKKRRQTTIGNISTASSMEEKAENFWRGARKYVRPCYTRELKREKERLMIGKNYEPPQEVRNAKTDYSASVLSAKLMMTRCS